MARVAPLVRPGGLMALSLRHGPVPAGRRMFEVSAQETCELAQRHGLSLGRATERISIVPATKDVAMHLGIPAGANVMKLDRIAETADGKPIEWRVTFRKI